MIVLNRNMYTNLKSHRASIESDKLEKIYWILIFLIVALPVTTNHELRFPYFPWRTVLDEESTLKKPQDALCKLPPFRYRQEYFVVDKPDARPGDLFENVTLVHLDHDSRSKEIDGVIIKALHCVAGEWTRSIFRFQSEELYFNTTWCPMLCKYYKFDDGMTASQRQKEIHNTIEGNRSSSKSCILPPYPPGGGFISDDVPDGKPGDVFDRSLSLRTYEPLRGGEIYRVKTILCDSGVWFTKILKFDSNFIEFSVGRWCPLLCAPSSTEKTNEPFEVNETTTMAVEITEGISKCQLPPYPQDGNYTVTNRPQATPGDSFNTAHLVYSCHFNKKIVGTKSVFCVDGVWSDETPKCVSCGSITSTPGQNLSGESTLRKELPWHASIYTKKYTPYRQICSGTIIATNFVVTAAHCFWSEIETLQPASRFAVAVGKIYPSWNDPRDNVAQTSDVNEIKTSKKFRGSLNYFKDDIALLILTTPLLYDDLVSPICLDFDVQFDEQQLKHDNYGKIASWSSGSSGAADDESSTLQVGWLPYVAKDKCVSDATSDLRVYLTSDKICAGGSGLCARDGGAGLAFQAPIEELSQANFYLRGIKSVTVTDGELCSAVNIFTHVQLYEAFLKDNLRSAIW